MAVNLSPVGGAASQFFDNNGVMLTGGKIFTYAAGTTTPQTAYTSSSGNIAHSNPIILDASGRVPGGEIWLTSTLSYKFVLKDSLDVLIGTYDNIVTQLNTNASLVTYTPAGSGAVSTTVQDKLRQTISIKDFGAVCDGVTNDTVAVQTAIAAVGSNNVSLIVPGATLVSSNLTFAISTQLQFQNGGKFVGVAGTEVITIQRAPLADIQQIFQNCDSYSTVGMTVFPEWFGAVKDGSTDDRAAFQSALRFLRDVGGLIQLQAGFYAVSDRISIDYNNMTIQGAGNNTSWIKVTGTNKNGVVINGVAGTPIRNIMLRDFSVILATIATGASIGVLLNYTVFAIVERMQIHDFLVGFGMEGATNSQITKVGATYTGGVTNGFVGFNIFGGASGATAANASSILKDCYSSGTVGLTGQIGFKVYGSYMSDIQFDTCETALTNYGYSLDYTSAPNFNVDIIIRNPIVDRYFVQGILVDGLPSNGILQIIGGYSNPDTLGAAAQNFYFDTCLGAVNVVGHEFMALTNTINTDGLFADNCIGLTISGCVFSMLNKGVRMTSCGYSLIANNVFVGGNPSAFNKMVEIIGGARVMVNGNSFTGATEGVVIDVTSSGCGIVGNTSNVATVATRYTNAGSGPIGGADGSTGLNSGI